MCESDIRQHHAGSSDFGLADFKRGKGSKAKGECKPEFILESYYPKHTQSGGSVMWNKSLPLLRVWICRKQGTMWWK